MAVEVGRCKGDASRREESSVDGMDGRSRWGWKKEPTVALELQGQHKRKKERKQEKKVRVL